MLKALKQAIFGTSTKRLMQQYRAEAERINALWPKYKELTEDGLRGKTEEFRKRLANGESLEDIKHEAFATVREACRRLVGTGWDVRGKKLEWDMVPYDVQMIGGLVLHDGKIAEMATGEGKTLVAVAPLYLNALEGKGAHLVTVNDYLAQRDSEWMGGVFRYLGMTVGVIITDMDPVARRAAYACDVTYGTNNEFGFDYLRDNMAISRRQLVHRDFHYTIIDEVDSVLIDEARTPLIISGQVDRSNDEYLRMKPTVEKIVKAQNNLANEIMAEAKRLMERHESEAANLDKEELRQLEFELGTELVKAQRGLPKQRQYLKAMQDVKYVRMKERAEREIMLEKAMREVDENLYFVIDEKGHTIDLTDKGREFIAPKDPDQFVLGDIVEEYAAIEATPGLSDEEKAQKKEEARRTLEAKQEIIHSISQLLRAYTLYIRDDNYLIQDEKVVIIDEHTGRQMPGRRWSDGLHQAVEAKEGVKVEAETQTLATVTLQNYFRMYKKLSGMTGTAETESQEFSHTYQMDVMVIPTNRPIVREDEPDCVYQTKREKFNAILDEIEELNREGLPVLVGTKTVEVSELLSKMLKRRKISHNVLNAKYHERESEIVAQAGIKGAVTIATNMAGRGTDIKLGEGVLREIDGQRTGGLQVIGTERHDSRRIDRQLRGRSGRQGDPGLTRFYVSIEDDLMRLFGSDRLGGLMQRLGMEEGEVIQSKLLTRSIESAQKKVENRNFDVRKRTLEYDDVMNKQRQEIYGMRRQTLMSDDVEEMRGLLLERVMDGVESVFADYGDPDGKPADWDVKSLREYMMRYCPFTDFSGLEAEAGIPAEQAYDKLMADTEEIIGGAFDQKREMLGDGLTVELARRVILITIDTDWRDHLAAMDDLRENVWTMSYAQKEPLTEYRRMASEAFTEMLDNISKEIFQHFFLTQVALHQEENQAPRVFFMKQSPEEALQQEAARQAAAANAQQSGPGGAPPARERVKRPVTVRRDQPKVGRNDPCPCGSGKKYKHCHGSARQLAGTGHES